MSDITFSRLRRTLHQTIRSAPRQASPGKGGNLMNPTAPITRRALFTNPRLLLASTGLTALVEHQEEAPQSSQAQTAAPVIPAPQRSHGNPEKLLAGHGIRF